MRGRGEGRAGLYSASLWAYLLPPPGIMTATDTKGDKIIELRRFVRESEDECIHKENKKNKTN